MFWILSVCGVLLLLSPVVVHKLTWKKYDFKSKHVIVTGGSKGLGRSLAIALSKKGANVSIVARGQKELDETKAKALSVKQSEKQKIEVFTCDVSDKKSVSETFQKIDSLMGPPDCIIPCAGLAIPKLFLESKIEEYEKQMSVNYFGSLSFVLESSKRMKENGIKGRIVFVTSTMSLISFIGYCSYSPTKWAVRAVSDCLRQELAPYGIQVQICYPPSMDTEGFVEENKTKPALTKMIEDLGDLMKPEQVADKLIQGIEKGGQHISFDLLTELQRIYVAGLGSRGNFFFEILILPILGLVLGGALRLLDILVLMKTKAKKQE